MSSEIDTVRPSTTCFNPFVGERCSTGEVGYVDTGMGEMHPAEDANVDEAEAGEAAEVLRTLPTPLVPGKSEVDAHRATHCP